jgi:hypothetical protein
LKPGIAPCASDCPADKMTGSQTFNRDIGNVRDKRTRGLARRRDPKTPLGADFTLTSGPIGQCADEFRLQQRMAACRAHLLERAPAHPLALGLGHREDDIGR